MHPTLFTRSHNSVSNKSKLNIDNIRDWRLDDTISKMKASFKRLTLFLPSAYRCPFSLHLAVIPRWQQMPVPPTSLFHSKMAADTHTPSTLLSFQDGGNCLFPQHLCFIPRWQQMCITHPPCCHSKIVAIAYSSNIFVSFQDDSRCALPLHLAVIPRWWQMPLPPTSSFHFKMAANVHSPTPCFHSKMAAVLNNPIDNLLPDSV